MRPLSASILAIRRSAAALASAAGSSTTISWRWSREIIRSELPPAAAVAFQQFLRSLRTLASGLIVLEPGRARLPPGIEERLNRLPAGFHAVGALKQDVVADHAVIEQRLVAGRGLGLEIILVAKLHFDAAGGDRRPRHLGVELQRDAFGGLDADHEIVLSQLLDGRAGEHRKGRLAELDRHFRALEAKRLAGAQIEGDAGPAPIVDGQFQRGVGLGGTVGIDVLGLAIVRYLGIAAPAAGILGA